MSRASRALPPDDTRLRETVEEALQIARERASLLGEVKAALIDGDHAAAIALMRRYVGLPPLEAKP